ncbi:MAG: Uma2 family endonuclease [Anaerolineae bacterium]|nr:Uma2 family endonuclease [Anaerolineae bacterium]
MVARRQPQMAVDEYLDFERNSDTKHEYFDGEIFAMAGASPNHNIITSNTITHLTNQIGERSCIVFASDQMIRTPSGLYAYPDISVVCGTPQYDEKATDILLNPTLIVEVLSPSTENYNRGEKFRHFKTISTLREYVLIAQDTHRVERYAYQSGSDWLFANAMGLTGEIELKSIGITLDLARLYRNITLPTQPLQSGGIT